MKTNFKNAVMAATALLLGFSSCSNNDENGPEADNSPKKNVTVRISVPSTYSDQVTAVGETPVVTEATVFFVDAVSIKYIGTLATADINLATGKEFTDVPGSVTKAVIIGNGATYATDPAISTIQVDDPVSELDALLFQQSVQDETDPTKVNVIGSGNVTDGTGAFAGKKVATATLYPAISRYEIAKVEAKTTGATIPLTSFELAGIYINNTYQKLGTDYITATTAVNYGSTSTAWTDGSYPARFKDEFTTLTGAASYTPANKWSYYVLPVNATAGGEGTLINSLRQTVIPHIVLKIKDAVSSTSHIFPEYTYVTIRNLEVSGSPIDELLKGKVYTIATIAIDGSNLTTLPETNPTEDITVLATISPWIEQAVDPGF